MRGFINFLRTQGVVGLAVGFILGGAISAMVASIVTNLVNPILGIGLSKVKSLADASIMVGGATITYGKFLSDLINFVVVAAVVYFIVKGLRFDRLDKAKE